MPAEHTKLNWNPPLAHRVLWTLLYESERLLTSFSVHQFLLFDLRKAHWERAAAYRKKSKEKKSLQDAIRYLERAAYLTTTNKNHQRIYHLTVKGRLQALATAALILPKLRRQPLPTAMTKQWLVIFDIPEHHRKLRDLFRRVLYGLGGKLIQKSVFLLRDPEGHRVVRHIVHTAKLRPHVIMVQMNHWER